MAESTSEINIRALSLDELTLLGPLWESAGLPHRPSGRDSVANLRTQWECFRDGFIGAFDGDSLVGAVLATNDGRRGWINRLAVLPGYRGRNLGRGLIDSSERVLKEKGLLIIAALIEADNLPSRALFKNAGYELLPEVLYYSKRESPSV